MRLASKVRSQAARQDRQLSAAERNGDVVVRRFVRAINRRAEFAVRRGQPFTLLPTDRAAIKSALSEVMTEAYVKRYNMESSRVKREAQLGFSTVVRQLARTLDIDLGDVSKTFDWLLRDRTEPALDALESRVNRVLRHVVSQQLPTGTAVREMRRVLAHEGIVDKSPSIVETLVRTHSQLAFGAAQYAFDRSDPLNLIWGYTYSTVGDDRVRDSHAAMHGVTRPKDDPIWDIWWPPNGWNCRCQLVAIIGIGTSTDVPDDAEPDEGFGLNVGKLMFAS